MGLLLVMWLVLVHAATWDLKKKKIIKKYFILLYWHCWVVCKRLEDNNLGSESLNYSGILWNLLVMDYHNPETKYPDQWGRNSLKPSRNDHCALQQQCEGKDWKLDVENGNKCPSWQVFGSGSCKTGELYGHRLVEVYTQEHSDSCSARGDLILTRKVGAPQLHIS